MIRGFRWSAGPRGGERKGPVVRRRLFAVYSKGHGKLFAAAPSGYRFLQALFVPVVAAVGGWIAAKQMLIAHDKVRRDAFDKLYDRGVLSLKLPAKQRQELRNAQNHVTNQRGHGSRNYPSDPLFLWCDVLRTGAIRCQAADSSPGKVATPAGDRRRPGA